jgi:hypothetical protein
MGTEERPDSPTPKDTPEDVVWKYVISLCTAWVDKSVASWLDREEILSDLLFRTTWYLIETVGDKETQAILTSEWRLKGLIHAIGRACVQAAIKRPQALELDSVSHGLVAVTLRALEDIVLKEQAQAVEQELGNLPKDLASLVEQVRAGRSQADIARDRDVSPQAISKKLAKTLTIIRARLAERKVVGFD